MSAATSFGVLPVDPARIWWRPSRRRGGQASQAVADAVQLGRPADVASESPDPGTPPVSDAAGGLAGTRDPRGAGRAPGRRVLAAVPLAGVLVIQAALSVRLLRADTAYQGEAESL